MISCSFVKNAGLGFAIPWLHNGEHHEYLPDFIVRLVGGGERYLILEIYIVSCDRVRVEQALGEKEQGLSGRDYLEKIIQWSFDLPKIPGHLLKQQLIEATEKDRKRETARTAKEVVDAMIDCLFPAGARLCRTSNGDPEESHANERAAEHLAERRVAHEHVLRLYLERVTSPELLAFHDAERALARMTDGDRLNEFIRSLDPARWQDVVSNLCDLSDRFRPEHVEPGIAVLLNLWPDMPERQSSSSILGNDDSRSIVQRATYLLLHPLEDTAAVEPAVRHILPEAKSFSSKVELVLLVGHRENSGYKLVSETVAYEFENMLRYEIRAAPADVLAEERDPLRVLVFAKHYGSPTVEPFEIDASPKLTFALLRSTRWEAATASSGALTVVLSPALGPETLVDLYGDKEVLKTRINDLKAGFDTLKPWLDTRRIPLDEAEKLLDLADRYLSGPRPDTD